MINSLPKIGLRFIFLVLLQVLVLNNVAFNRCVNPYLYVLFVLTLPFKTPRWLSLLLGFFLGLSIDIFTSTLGMHVSATLFMCYLRDYVLKFLSPRDDYDPLHTPGIKDMGFSWFMSFSSFLVFFHHAFLFFVETFSFNEFFPTILRTISSSIFTLILIFISQLLVYKRK